MNAILDDLLQLLPSIHRQHAAGSPFYSWIKRVARREVEERFSRQNTQPVPFGPFGELIFPYVQMGAIDSVNLFDLDELILFSFYWTNRHRYRRVVDIGANLGLHSLILARCGYEVKAFEPDPKHFNLLKQNLASNNCSAVEAIDAAVSNRDGLQDFIRVMDNTTGSHLAGSKAKAYGNLERFPVRVVAVSDAIRGADLVKIDAEGHEKDILLATRRDSWSATDAVVEVGSAENARSIFDHFTRMGIGLFAQKLNWGRVEHVQSMPESYRGGTLFITCRDEVPWQQGEHV